MMLPHTIGPDYAVVRDGEEIVFWGCSVIDAPGMAEMARRVADAEHEEHPASTIQITQDGLVIAGWIGDRRIHAIL